MIENILIYRGDVRAVSFIHVMSKKILAESTVFVHSRGGLLKLMHGQIKLM